MVMILSLGPLTLSCMLFHLFCVLCIIFIKWLVSLGSTASVHREFKVSASPSEILVKSKTLKGKLLVNFISKFIYPMAMNLVKYHVFMS